MKENRNNISLIFLLSVLIIFYGIFSFIFFFILNENSIEFLIAFSFIFLVYILYKNFSKNIYIFLWNLSKEIWLHLSSLLLILKSISELVKNMNNIYLKFLIYKTTSLIIINFSLNDIWFQINKNIMIKFFINEILSLFFGWLYFFNERFKYLNNKLLFKYNNKYLFRYFKINILKIFYLFKINNLKISKIFKLIKF